MSEFIFTLLLKAIGLFLAGRSDKKESQKAWIKMIEAAIKDGGNSVKIRESFQGQMERLRKESE